MAEVGKYLGRLSAVAVYCDIERPASSKELDSGPVQGLGSKDSVRHIALLKDSLYFTTYRVTFLHFSPMDFG